MKFYNRCLAIVGLLVGSGSLNAATLTNADVIKMVEAKLDEGIILSAVAGSEGRFDVSSDGIIELSKAKVPQIIIEAVIKKSSAVASSSLSTAAAGPAAVELMKPSDVVMIDGEEQKVMRYLNPQVRTAARGLGFGGVASYAVLRNASASMRLKNPSFLVAVPEQAQPESYFTLASFAVRKNNSREVLIGGGYMSYSTGIHPDRVMAVKHEKASDQSKAQKGFIVYKVTPASPLPAGEYAVILYTAEMHGLVGAWFSGTGNSYFDFGVD